MGRWAGAGLLGCLVACGLAGCGDDDGTPDAGRDAAPPDGSVARDAEPSDGSMDATSDGSRPDADLPDGAPSDAGADADGGFDAGADDAGPDDAGSDASVDAGGCAPTDRCSCDEPVGCGAGCAADYVCIDDGCGAEVCAPAGAACDTDADCRSGVSCVETDDDGLRCAPPGGPCVDSRDCPAGFACEEGGCVDRRVPCIDRVDCPWGYVCNFADQGAFCERVSRPCDSSKVCGGFGDCVDVDGDGEAQCSGEPGCTTNADCDAGEVCGTHPVSRAAVCGALGPCDDDDDCASGHSCVDGWGDGNAECLPEGGTCQTNADCPPRQVCGVVEVGDPPGCVIGRETL